MHLLSFTYVQDIVLGCDGYWDHDNDEVRHIYTLTFYKVNFDKCYSRYKNALGI